MTNLDVSKIIPHKEPPTVRELLEEAFSIISPSAWTKGWGDIEIINWAEDDKPAEVKIETCTMGAIYLAEMAWFGNIDTYTDPSNGDQYLNTPTMDRTAKALCVAMKELHPRKFKEAVLSLDPNCHTHGEMTCRECPNMFDIASWSDWTIRPADVVIAFNDQGSTKKSQVINVFRHAIKAEIQKEETA